jgi:hypothetical protein
MQLSDIRTEIRNITGVSSTSTISDAILTDLINKGQNMLADEANLFSGYATRNAVDGTAEYQMLDDAVTVSAWTRNEHSASTSTNNLNNLIRIYRVDYDGNRMDRIGVSQIENIGSDVADINLTTSYGYYIRQNFIGIFPTPSATKEIKIYYYHIPKALSSDGDTPKMDERHHEALIYYGSWKVVERLRDINLIPYFKNEWNEWKDKIILDRQSRAGESSITVSYKDF